MQNISRSYSEQGQARQSIGVVACVACKCSQCLNVPMVHFDQTVLLYTPMSNCNANEIKLKEINILKIATSSVTFRATCIFITAMHVLG